LSEVAVARIEMPDHPRRTRKWKHTKRMDELRWVNRRMEGRGAMPRRLRRLRPILAGHSTRNRPPEICETDGSSTSELP
jgi:hypothetical protein